MGWEGGGGGAAAAGRGGGGVGTHYVSVGRDVPSKGVHLSETVSDGGIIPLYKFWEGAQIYLSGKVSACLERGC